MKAKPRTTEKTKTVLEQSETPASENDSEPPSDKTPGHGRNGFRPTLALRKLSFRIRSYMPANHVRVVKKAKSIRRKNLRLWSGSWDNRRWRQRCTKLDRLRCHLCGEVFTAQEPEGVGPGKYDETTAAIIAC
jgi:hypothetical protein